MDDVGDHLVQDDLERRDEIGGEKRRQGIVNKGRNVPRAFKVQREWGRSLLAIFKEEEAGIVALLGARDKGGDVLVDQREEGVSREGFVLV